MKSHRTIYWIVAGLMAALLVVMLITFRYNRANEEALTKANQLISAFQGAGLTAPKDPARVASVFGTDGGTVCGSVGSGVGRGIAKLNLMVGGTFATRPVINEAQIGTGLVLIVKTYCPQKLPETQQFVDNLRFNG
jgi:hypothetical protein